MRPRIQEQSVLNSGNYHERDAFGLPMVDQQKYSEKLKQLKDKFGSDSASEKGGVTYLPRREAMDLIIETALPLKAKQPFTVSLREAVVRLLHVEDPKNLRIFSAVKTPLDIYHGVDAFVRYTPSGGKPIDITLDITKEKAKENYKADIVLSGIEVDPESNERQFKQGVQFAAEDIVKRIKQELDRREQTKGHGASWRAAA